MELSSRIAIIGSQDSFAGFMALGVTVLEPNEENNAGSLLESLSPDEFGIVFIAEPFAETILEAISNRNRTTEQSVIVIPAGRESAGLAGDRIRQLVRRAVGADIV